MCVATVPPIRGDPISQSQAHIPRKTLPSANDQCVDIICSIRQLGVWGLAHVFNNKLFFTRDIMDDDAVPKPAPKPNTAPKPGPKGQHRQEFRMVYRRKKGFTSEPVEH